MVLGSGFTSAISHGSVHQIDVHLRDAIDRCQVPGPRLLASGRDIGVTASNADLHPDHFRPQLADLVIVDGDPLTDIRVFQDHARITAVMKDGRLYRGRTEANPWLREPANR